MSAVAMVVARGFLMVALVVVPAIVLAADQEPEVEARGVVILNAVDRGPGGSDHLPLPISTWAPPEDRYRIRLGSFGSGCERRFAKRNRVSVRIEEAVIAAPARRTATSTGPKGWSRPSASKKATR